MHALQQCSNTPAPPVVPFALILADGRSLFLLGILRPARRAGHHPSRAAPSELGRIRDAARGTRLAGRARPHGPGSLYTVRRDLDGHGGPYVMGSRDLDGQIGQDVMGDASPSAPAALVGSCGGRTAWVRGTAGTW
jgi:hypothetical protein